ncbi:MAG: hypothetical protein RLZZ624_323, partial [Cyanobacteriota bacterium]
MAGRFWFRLAGPDDTQLHAYDLLARQLI